jgi:Raf kinase inhibitor-like YbhB/YbcL family protein
MALPHKPGDHALVWNDEALAAPESFRLIADWAGEGAGDTVEIPDTYRGRLFGRNVSPAVSWSDLPAGTVRLALIVQDPDTPMSGASTHLVALIDPHAVARLADGELSQGTDAAGVVLGRGSLKRGWAGPLPPKGHGPHRYVFQAYALSRPVGLGPGFRLAELRGELSDGLLGRARLIGTHETR